MLFFILLHQLNTKCIPENVNIVKHKNSFQFEGILWENREEFVKNAHAQMQFVQAEIERELLGDFVSHSLFSNAFASPPPQRQHQHQHTHVKHHRPKTFLPAPSFDISFVHNNQMAIRNKLCTFVSGKIFMLIYIKRDAKCFFFFISSYRLNEAKCGNVNVLILIVVVIIIVVSLAVAS